MFGLGAYVGGIVTRRYSPLHVASVTQATGVFFSLMLVWLRHDVPADDDVFLGAIAGIGSGVGFFALYKGLARGEMGVVAPLSAMLAVLLPATLGLLQGTLNTWKVPVGILLAMLAIALLSTTDVDAARVKVLNPGRLFRLRVDVTLALLSGIGFAGSAVIFGITAARSGLWPLVSARMSATIIFVAIALVTLGPLRWPLPDMVRAMSAGLFETGGAGLFLLAISEVGLTVAAVFSGLSPLVTVLLARFLLKQRLNRRGQAGMVLALLAGTLVSSR